MSETMKWQPFPDVMPPYDYWLFVTTEETLKDGTVCRRLWCDVIAIIHPEDDEIFFFQPQPGPYGDDIPVEGMVIAWMPYPKPYQPDGGQS